MAVLNTNLTTAISLLTWTAMDIIFYKKPSIIGAVNGMITGLVAITPAAGVIAGWGCFIMGVASGTIPWISMNIVGKRSKLFTHYVDDCLGITHTHMVAGFVGGFLVGIFATPEGSYAFGLINHGGAITGNGRQVWLQLVGALFIIGWNLVWTSLIMLFIKHVLRIPLRMTEEELLIGDDAIHGEEAYCFTDDVTGLVPTESVEQRALEKMEHIHTPSGFKDPSFLEGQRVPHSNGEGSSGTPPHKNGDGNEVKLD